ncbi:MAG TPA: hypothetical protein VGS22_02835 [Thermoanaerobaculia bacterium]|jgi:hypothetical protein|nr:hypothetical protein [Thermoanaerobaculia bacterium]
MSRFDYSLYDRFGQLAALVEVKSVYGRSAEWASQLRRNLLARGEIPGVAFLLIVTPERVFLWKEASAADPLAPPDYQIDADPLFRPYLPKSGPAAERRAVGGQAFELVVFAWLSDLMRDTDEPAHNPATLADSGFPDAVRQGRIEYQEAA